MDKTKFYNALDIDGPEEFIYYDNLSALLEEDDFVENNLIYDLIKEIDLDNFNELIDTYFEEFLKSIPDEENDMYITVSTIRDVLTGLIRTHMEEDDLRLLSSEIGSFRKWYVHDLQVHNLLEGEEVSVRDARYDIMACKLLGQNYNYDFADACKYETDGYDVNLGEIQEIQIEEQLID